MHALVRRRTFGSVAFVIPQTELRFGQGKGDWGASGPSVCGFRDNLITAQDFRRPDGETHTKITNPTRADGSDAANAYAANALVDDEIGTNFKSWLWLKIGYEPDGVCLLLLCTY